jgi:antitoxin component YwqK of YwqJK toxin-antitoxin module
MKWLKSVFVLISLMAVVLLLSCNRPERSYWPDGSKKSEIPYDENGKIHGTAKWWNEDGTPMLEADYVHGQLHGKLVRYMEKVGVKQTEDNYVDGKQNGLSIEWDYDGVKVREQNYVNDTLHGISRKWYHNEQPLEEGEYVNGMMQGEWIYYDIAGNIIGRGEFDNGNGIKKIFSPSGRQLGQVRFENNQEVR